MSEIDTSGEYTDLEFIEENISLKRKLILALKEIKNLRDINMELEV